MAYFNSDSVNVFPSALRTTTLSGKYTSEQNFVNILNSITDIDSYVLDYSNETLKVVIHGYYFEVVGITINQNSYPNLWLQIKVETGVINSNTLVNFANESVELDSGSEFQGLQYLTAQPTNPAEEDYTVYTLRVAENGVIVNRVRLKADSIQYDSHYTVAGELDRKQHKLLAGDGLTIDNLSTTTDTQTIRLEEDEFDKLSSLNNKGDQSQFVYFDAQGKAHETEIDAGLRYTSTTGSGINYNVSRATYTESGKLNSGVGVYSSVSSPSNEIGSNGDIWLKYTG